MAAAPREYFVTAFGRAGKGKPLDGIRGSNPEDPVNPVKRITA